MVREDASLFEAKVKVLGYGANDDSLLPSFSPTWISFVTLYGGIVAFPNIRGGSEFGKDWANAGQKSHVMNGVRDFISATYAEFQFSRGMNFQQMCQSIPCRGKVHCPWQGEYCRRERWWNIGHSQHCLRPPWHIQSCSIEERFP